MKTYAEIINLASVMSSGIKADAERVQKKEIGKEFAPKLETLVNEAKTINNEQETLKAKLKTKTDELNTKWKR